MYIYKSKLLIYYDFYHRVVLFTDVRRFTETFNSVGNDEPRTGEKKLAYVPMVTVIPMRAQFFSNFYFFWAYRQGATIGFFPFLLIIMLLT